MYRVGIARGAFLPVLIIAAAMAGPARAEQVCVRCDNPFALYACDIVHPDVTASTPVGFLCIKELARRYGHQTCGVSRGTGGRCAGEAIVLALPPNEPLPAAARPAGAIRPESGDVATQTSPEAPRPDGEKPLQTPAKGEDQEGPPKTVKELAESTVEASKKGLETAEKGVVDAAKKTGEVIGDTGEVIGDAAKKTWRCLKSFFGDC